jgi:hypothetical protein
MRKMDHGKKVIDLLKTIVAQVTVGSNPTLSAKPNYRFPAKPV